MVHYLILFENCINANNDQQNKNKWLHYMNNRFFVNNPLKAVWKVTISRWNETYKMLDLLLKKAAHRCKMKGIVFKVEGPINDLVLRRQTGSKEEIGLYSFNR